MPVVIVKETDSLIGGLFHVNNRTLSEWRHLDRIELNPMDVGVLALLGAMFSIIGVLLVFQLCCCLKRSAQRRTTRRSVGDNVSLGETVGRDNATEKTNKLANLAYFVDSDYNRLHNKM